MIKKQLKQNEEIGKIIEKEQVICFKKKPNPKIQKDSDEEIESANSLKSGVFSEDSDSKYNKKNSPLPELYRDKKRIFHKQFLIAEPKQVNNYLEKEVRQHDNLVLKQKNNLLATENMKLKTKVMALEKEIGRISKGSEEDQKPKQPSLTKDNKFKGSEALSLKMALKNLRKELDEQKKDNEKIKCSVKFTRISELECERDEILTETTRLRLMLQEQQLKRASLKSKEQGLSNFELKLQTLTEKNIALSKENSELQKRIKGIEENSRKLKMVSENEKNLSKMLFNAKRLIKDKEKEIESLKGQTPTDTKIESVVSIMEPKSLKEVAKSVQPKSKDKLGEKRIGSKSAQKYRKKIGEQGGNMDCQNCQKYKEMIKALQTKIEELALKLKSEKENNAKFGSVGDFSRDEIDMPNKEEVDRLARFLTFRFKAHHLNLEQAQKYLINGELNETTRKETITVLEMAESLMAQPFSILSSRYLEVCLVRLFYSKELEKGQPGKIKIDENKKLTKGEILSSFLKLVQSYEVMSQEKEEEMFIQIAELVTNYHQHILTALNRKRNGEGTIAEGELINFFNEIELEREFVEFIVCQIILESLDLEHLNYYTMFEIFYMPPQVQGQSEPNQPNKKKFQVEHSQVVKQEDEEYEESKSHIDSRQKTLSRPDDENEDNEGQPNKFHNQDLSRERDKPMPKKEDDDQDDYEQVFEEQKMQQLPQQEKAHEQNDQTSKPYPMQQMSGDDP